MKLYDISQLPVLLNNKAVGMVDESDLLLALYSGERSLTSPVKEVMTKNIVTVQRTSGQSELINIFNKGLVAIIENDKGIFEGIVTQIDLINHIQSPN